MRVIIYFGIAYFGWLPLLIATGVLYLKWNDKSIFLTPIIAGVLQFGGLILHVYEHNRLMGHPDQMYSWIVPLLLSTVGWVVIAVGIVRLLLKHKEIKKRV